MTETIDIAGNEHIGVYCRAFDDVVFAASDAPDRFIEVVGEELSVPVVRTTIQGCSIIGSLLVGNNRGFIVSGMATPDEIAVLQEYRDVLLLERGMNAAGNIILANDDIAVVHPDMPDRFAEEIAEFLEVPVLMMPIGGVPTVGMTAVATSRGILLPTRASRQEIEAIEEHTDLPVGTGTVNMGTNLIGTGLVANKSGYIAGSATSGYELGRIEEVFGFVE
ncbi:translation initiation factor IF-6 [Methanogenium organophilum]|uniref:Translation initiation factor 6 n=1 Tax=Methanogenium organophilum TaxID=2199 RepID=A0A9X9T823_METOG|nr:translation initiation factor IF-6 [Methanogenium organophilum]WAI00717.1 translation initiation factor IF-6 [Methanogenium organophilum]